MASASINGGLQIAPATRADVPLILSLIRELADYERLTDTLFVTEAMLESALFGPRPMAEAILVQLDGQPAAYAVYFPTYNTFFGKTCLYLEDLFVRPEGRGRGIGRAVMEYLARLCADRRYPHIAWLVLDWNEPAIEFYKKLGAQPARGGTLFQLTGDPLVDLAESNPTAKDGQLRIAAATREDAPTLVSLIRELADYERLSDKVCVTQPMLEAALFSPRPVAEAILGRVDGQPVAYAVFFTAYNTFSGKPCMHLEDLLVRTAARGRGVGLAMMKCLAGICAERGYQRMEWLVLDWNQLAIEFYKRLGAEPVRGWTFFRVTGDALTHLAESK